MQLGLGRLLQLRDPQAGGGRHVGHVGTGAARDRVHADAVAVGRGGAGEGGGHVEQLVETVDPGDAELAEDRRGHGVRTGEVAGVGLGHRAPFVGAPNLDGDDGHLLLGGPVGGQHQGPPVLEALDVAGDGAHFGLIGEPGAEVGELEVGLVARGGPVREADADLLALEDGPSLVAALGDEGDGLAGQVVAEELEGVEVGVGPEKVDVALGDDLLHVRLQELAFGAHLGEAGGEDDGELDLLLDGLLESGHGVAHEDGGQVDVDGHVEDRGIAREAADLGSVGVHQMDVGAGGLGPAADLDGHRRIGPPGAVGRPHHGHRARVEEGVEVDVAELHRSPGDVELRPRRLLRHESQVRRRPRERRVKLRAWRRPS